MIPELKPARRGYTVRYKNKTLLSTVDPVSQAERAAASAPLSERTLYVCPSPLLGYGLDALASRISVDSAVLCVETDAELLGLSHTHIDKELLGRPALALTGLQTEAELCSFVRKKWGSRSFRRVEVLKLSGGWQLDAGTYEAMAERLRGAIAAEWGNALTLIKLGRRFMYNFIRNLPCLLNARPVTDLSFGSKPVLVLGAGPSLDPLLDRLEESGLTGAKDGIETNSNRLPRGLPGQNRPFVLICVDTCLPILKERNITPDLVVILESQFWNLNDFAGSRDSGIPAAVDMVSYPGSVELLGGRLFFFCTPWTPLRIFERLGAALPPTLPPLGSVSLSAVELARRLGSGPVLCGGIDFAYTLDATHARGSPAHLSALRRQNRFASRFNAATVFRPGVVDAVSKLNGNVKTDPAMRMYRNLFEEEFSGGRVKDIAGNGLYLGLETLSLDEAVTVLSGCCMDRIAERNGAAVLEQSGQVPEGVHHTEKLRIKLTAFVKQEKATLEELREFLSGSSSAKRAGGRSLDDLLDGVDYLWAHFPDCAGAEGKRPPSSDVVFLKRVRAELEPFIKLWDLAETGIAENTRSGFVA